jgi:E3 ubiquitin-protein ligase HERC2
MNFIFSDNVCILYICFTYFRGKGDNFRLGHGSEEHIRHPKQIDALGGKKVLDIAIGSMHCVAITEDGELFGWGRNEHGQLGDSSSNCRSVPTILSGLDGKNIIGASCGPNQVYFCVF